MNKGVYILSRLYYNRDTMDDVTFSLIVASAGSLIGLVTAYMITMTMGRGDSRDKYHELEREVERWRMSQPDLRPCQYCGTSSHGADTPRCGGCGASR